MDIHRMPGHLIRRLNQISMAVFADRMAQAGLALTPVQFAALMAVRDHPGIDQAGVAGLIAHDRVTIGKVIDRLAARGWIARTPSPTDRRAKALHLTPDGAETLRAALPHVEAAQPAILAGLSAQERAQLLTLLEKATLTGNDLSRAPLRPVSLPRSQRSSEG